MSDHFKDQHIQREKEKKRKMRDRMLESDDWEEISFWVRTDSSTQKIKDYVLGKLEDLPWVDSLRANLPMKHEVERAESYSYKEQPPSAGENEVVLDYSVTGEKVEDGWYRVIETGSFIYDEAEFRNEVQRLEEEYGFTLDEEDEDSLWNVGGERLEEPEIENTDAKLVKLRVRK